MGCNVLPVDCLKVDTFEDNGGHTQIIITEDDNGL